MVIPVLQYHRIDVPGRNVLVRGSFTPPARFARQLAYLKSRGAVFYTASELVEHFLQHGRFPPKGISVTLDDGCSDAYTNAFPVLHTLGIKATMFVVPSCIGQVTNRTLAQGEQPRPHLSREEILESARNGIEFGSHTVSHRLLHLLRAQIHALDALADDRFHADLLNGKDIRSQRQKHRKYQGENPGAATALQAGEEFARRIENFQNRHSQ